MLQCCILPDGAEGCVVDWDCVSAPPEAPKYLPWNDRYGEGGGSVIGVERRKLFDDEEVKHIRFLTVLYDSHRIGGDKDGLEI